MSYTKGPWSFNVIRKCRYIGGENHVEYELKDSEGKDIMPTIENARLHAAAPELLDALEWFATQRYYGDESRYWKHKALEVIAKARGEK
jgi:hypothetical protein